MESVLQKPTSCEVSVLQECAWCGGECFTEFRNKRAEFFCSKSHRDSNNRALKRLLDRACQGQEHD